MSLNWLTMTDEEFIHNVRQAAWAFASAAFTKANAGSTAAEAGRFADRHWRQFEDRALDFAALCAATQQAEATAPYN
jgi:hypothetical protein